MMALFAGCLAAIGMMMMFKPLSVEWFGALLFWIAVTVVVYFDD